LVERKKANIVDVLLAIRDNWITWGDTVRLHYGTTKKWPPLRYCVEMGKQGGGRDERVLKVIGEERKDGSIEKGSTKEPECAYSDEWVQGRSLEQAGNLGDPP